MPSSVNEPLKAFRGRQFTLRGLLVVVLLCAAGAGVWTTYVEPYRREARVAQQLKERGAAVTFEPDGPAWLRTFAGKDFCQCLVRVDLGPGISDDDLKLLHWAPEYLSDLHDLPVRIDREALVAAEVNPLTPVTATMSGVSLQEALDQTLVSVDLDWALDGAGVVITTKTAAKLSRPGITELRQTLPKLKRVEVAGKRSPH